MCSKTQRQASHLNVYNLTERSALTIANERLFDQRQHLSATEERYLTSAAGNDDAKAIDCLRDGRSGGVATAKAAGQIVRIIGCMY